MQLDEETSFAAAPRRVHEVLTDGVASTATTHMDAILGDAAAGAAEGHICELLGGNIEVRDIELVPGERVVQVWRISDWESGVYSLVRMTLTRDDERTRMTFDQFGPFKKFLGA